MRRRVTLITAVLALASPAPALAASGGYNSSPTVSGVTAGQQTASAGTTPQQQGTLPFTGLDTGLMAGAGAALVGFGIALRMGARRRSTDS